MAAFLTLGSAASSLSFPAMLSGDVVSGSMRHGLFALFFIGFGVKAGLIPFHVWLPEAHPAAPSSVSAFMSAVLITAGITVSSESARSVSVPRTCTGRSYSCRSAHFPPSSACYMR